MAEQISKKEAERQVLLLARRCASLYQSFAEALVNELGEEKGKALILKAIEDYGAKSGENVKQKVEESKAPKDVNNYFKHSDLPKLGWVANTFEDNGKIVKHIDYCPMAEYWLEEMDPELARLYCHVDQVKYDTYNPALEFRCVKNVLDGEQRCVHVFTPQETDLTSED